MNRDDGLEISIKNGLLSISIGVNTLAFAAEEADYIPAQGQKLFKIKVNNPDQFADDVIDKLTQEDEKGENPLTRLLDKTFEEVYNWGSEAIDYED